MIAADVRWPHQKSPPLGPSFPARRHRLRRLLVSCSSRRAGAGPWWLSLLPPTSPGCSAGDHRERTEGGGKKREIKQNHENRAQDPDLFGFDLKESKQRAFGLCLCISVQVRDYIWKLEVTDPIQRTGKRATGPASPPNTHTHL